MLRHPELDPPASDHASTKDSIKALWGMTVGRKSDPLPLDSQQVRAVCLGLFEEVRELLLLSTLSMFFMLRDVDVSIRLFGSLR